MSVRMPMANGFVKTTNVARVLRTRATGDARANASRRSSTILIMHPDSYREEQRSSNNVVPIT
jgi:hypothetical protein